MATIILSLASVDAKIKPAGPAAPRNTGPVFACSDGEPSSMH